MTETTTITASEWSNYERSKEILPTYIQQER